jgi:hypothetical protein
MKQYLLLSLALIGSLVIHAQEAAPSCQHMKQGLLSFNSTNPTVQADTLRSDTIDILKYTINLNFLDFTTDTIRGNTNIRFAARLNNVHTLSLDLLHMTVDSIRIGTTLLTYTYNDTLLITHLPVTMNIGDTSIITVYYHGQPVMDASGWGGFYFQNGIAYNLGVGFAANPHNFGRVWYPCFDNFTERAIYEFNIGATGGNIAYCNGLLVHDSTDINNVRIRKWVLNKTIPSYLACVAVGPYTQVNMTFPSLTGPKPVLLAELAADTVALKASFIHLPNAFAGFENRYGPFRWDKIGYSVVPFNSGAMEHASAIAYPQPFVDGTTTYESQLMAHELSHHWFGDLATCSNAGDMWLNEGWATYSQSIFLENVYGHTSFINNVLANHEIAIHYANWTEGGYRAVSGVPTQYTYGEHVYQKGADVAHTLRGYMGDSLFFIGLKYHLLHRQFTAVNSTQFRDDLQAGSGLSLTDFFNDWVFNPGWPHFSVDSFAVTPNGPNYNVTVYVKQKITGAPAFFNNVPLEVTFKDSLWHSIVEDVVVSGQHSNFTFTIPFKPSYAGMNLADKISHAVTYDSKVIKSTGGDFVINGGGRIRLSVTNTTITTDSAWIRIEHNYASPDGFKHPQLYFLDPDRYWKIDGIIPASFRATGQLVYDARNITSSGNGNLDNDFLTNTHLEDSIVVLYRANAADDWHLETNIVKTMGNLTDKYGVIQINNIRKGEFVLALKGFPNAVAEIHSQTVEAKVYPNPSADRFTVELNGIVTGKGDVTVYVHDMNGKLLFSEKVLADRFSIGSEVWKNGVYLMSVVQDGKLVCRNRLVVNK